MLMERTGSILVVEDDAAMRELLTEELADSGFTVQSAGSATGGLEIARSARFDLVVTLCDRVREVCPELPDHPRLVHWSMADPAQAGATDRASYPVFEQTARELEVRLRFLLPLLTSSASSPLTGRS